MLGPPGFARCCPFMLGGERVPRVPGRGRGELSPEALSLTGGILESPQPAPRPQHQPCPLALSSVAFAVASPWGRRPSCPPSSPWLPGGRSRGGDGEGASLRPPLPAHRQLQPGLCHHPEAQRLPPAGQPAHRPARHPQGPAAAPPAARALVPRGLAGGHLHGGVPPRRARRAWHPQDQPGGHPRSGADGWQGAVESDGKGRGGGLGGAREG